MKLSYWFFLCLVLFFLQNLVVQTQNDDNDNDDDDDVDVDVYSAQCNEDGDCDSETLIGDVSDSPVDVENIKQMTVKFKNNSGKRVALWWDDGKDGIFQTEIEDQGEVPIGTYIGHSFYYAPIDDPKKRLYYVTMILHIDSYNLLSEEKMKHKEEKLEKQKNKFMKEYFEKTGRRWQNYWPRGKIIHHYYDVQHINQKFYATSNWLHWHKCNETDNVPSEMLQHLANENEEYNKYFQIRLKKFKLMKKQDAGDELTQDELNILNSITDLDKKYNESIIDEQFGEVTSIRDKPIYRSFFNETNTTYITHYNGTSYCKPKSINNSSLLHFELTVLCTQPRVLILNNMLTPDECNHIIEVGSFIGLKRSTVTESALETVDRTSSTIWIERDNSPIIDEINRRVADIVHIDERLLFINASAESLQLVYYRNGDLYRPHHDYGTDSPNNRFITFLMYLNTPEKGGNTSFPNAHPSCYNGGEERDYFGIHPTQGSAAFFYNLHPDGNVDETSLHFAEPPLENSVKWMTNVWIWDPAFIKADSY